MAGPVFPAVGARAQSAGAVTLTPAKPSVMTTGGVLLAVCQTKNNAVHATATPGWVNIGQVNSGASFTASLWIAPESAAAPVFTWSGSVACGAQVAYLVSGSGNLDSAAGASSNSNGLTGTHTSTSVNTTRNDSLVLYVDAAAANTATATPAGWTENVDNGSATDAGHNSFGSKAVAVSGSASGAISISGANAAWVQWQVEIMMAAPAAALAASKVEADAWLDPPPGLVSTKIETVAWLDNPKQIDASKIEVVAWLDYVGSSGRRRMALG